VDAEDRFSINENEVLIGKNWARELALYSDFQNETSSLVGRKPLGIVLPAKLSIIPYLHVSLFDTLRKDILAGSEVDLGP